MEQNNTQNFSYSKISTYLECPKRYELQYIRNLVEFKENIYTAFGEAIHKAIELAINNKYDYDEAFAIFEKTLKERCKLIDPRDMQLIFLSEWYSKAKPIFKYFFDNFYNEIKDGKMEVIGTEKYFKYEILPNIFYNGIIDLLVKHIEEKEEVIKLPVLKTYKNGKQKTVLQKTVKKHNEIKYKIIDWKTGAVSTKDNLQLLSYTIPLLEQEKLLINEVNYVFLKHNKQSRTKVDENLVNFTKSKIISIINNIQESIQQNSFDMCLDKNKCKYCNVKKFCDQDFELLLKNNNSNK